MMTLSDLGDVRVRVHELSSPPAGSPRALAVERVLSARVYRHGAGYLRCRVPLCGGRGQRPPLRFHHRAVAEACLGRRLRPYEDVHHIRPDRKDNRPENLLVCSRKVHAFLHREPGCKLRRPVERQRRIACACGCGRTLLLFDGRGRRRRCVGNHHTYDRPTVYCRQRLALKRFKREHGLPDCMDLGQVRTRLSLPADWLPPGYPLAVEEG